MHSAAALEHRQPDQRGPEGHAALAPPGLIAAARRNADRGLPSARLFEVGRRYLADAERPTLGFVLMGDRAPRDWRSGRAVPFDAFDAKAEALALLSAAGAPADRLQVMAAVSPVYHPGRSATLRLGPKTLLAEFGELHPATARALGLDRTVVAGEIYLDALPQKRGSGPERPPFAPPALQAVRRDFAFVVAGSVAADDLIRAVRGADKTAIVDARVFDLFTGPGLGEGEQSIAIEVVLQPGEKSFTEAELTAISDKVVAAAAKLGARLRT
jgi:phenylalanyl-tRNA synthetase beta chain